MLAMVPKTRRDWYRLNAIARPTLEPTLVVTAVGAGNALKLPSGPFRDFAKKLTWN